MTRRKEYSDYLRSEKWKTLRKSALIQSGNKCQVCNDVKSLHVHHRKYPEVFGDEPLSDLTVLCQKCHNLFHEKSNLKNCSGTKKTKAEKTEKKRNEKKLKRRRAKTKIWLSGPCKKYSKEEITQYEKTIGMS
jgi:5-methylcytosine-specific restriction endonuclease McrA